MCATNSVRDLQHQDPFGIFLVLPSDQLSHRVQHQLWHLAVQFAPWLLQDRSPIFSHVLFFSPGSFFVAGIIFLSERSICLFFFGKVAFLSVPFACQIFQSDFEIQAAAQKRHFTVFESAVEGTTQSKMKRREKLASPSESQQSESQKSQDSQESQGHTVYPLQRSGLSDDFHETLALQNKSRPIRQAAQTAMKKNKELASAGKYSPQTPSDDDSDKEAGAKFHLANDKKETRFVAPILKIEPTGAATSSSSSTTRASAASAGAVHTQTFITSACEVPLLLGGSAAILSHGTVCVVKRPSTHSRQKEIKRYALQNTFYAYPPNVDTKIKDQIRDNINGIVDNFKFQKYDTEIMTFGLPFEVEDVCRVTTLCGLTPKRLVLPTNKRKRNGGSDDEEDGGDDDEDIVDEEEEDTRAKTKKKKA